MTIKHALRGSGWRVLVCLAGVLTLASCDNAKPDNVATEAALKDFEPVLTSPAGAAESLIRLLELEADARPNADSELNRTFVKQVLRVADGDAVYARLKDHVANVSARDEALAELVRNWAALIMYYRGGFDFDAVIGPLPSGDSPTPHLFIPATQGADKALLRVECVRHADEPVTWRVVRIEFVPLSMPAKEAEAATAAPTTQPTTAPSP